MFWGLSKPGQDALLWSLQSNSMQGENNSSDDDDDDDPDGASSCSSSNDWKHHVNWYVGGTRVCRRAFLRMLGVGCNRLNRTRDRFRGLDERRVTGEWLFVNFAATTSVKP